MVKTVGNCSLSCRVSYIVLPRDCMYSFRVASNICVQSHNHRAGMPVLCINYMKPVHINKHVVPTLCCYYTSMIEPWHADCRSLATSKLHHNFFLINFSHLRIPLPLGSYRVLQDICNLLQKITCMNNQQTIFQNAARPRCHI